MFKDKIILTVLSSALIIFAGCGGGDDAPVGQTVITPPAVVSTSAASVSGVAQKGPFVEGSKVQVCKLTSELECTKDIVETKVLDNMGRYKLVGMNWSGMSKITISGYYFDEVTGETSLSQASIEAIVNIKANVNNAKNTNILTHLQAKRIGDLVKKGKTPEDALEESDDEIRKIFNIKAKDFTELNLVDFSEGKASVNAELLRISAAIAKSKNPVGDLEELMKIYDEGGLAAVLESSLYQKLMSDVDDVDVLGVLNSLDVSSEITDAIDIASITIAPFARASMRTNGIMESANEVVVTLFGTTFTSQDPAINLSVSGGELVILSKTLSEDNKSVILEMDKDSSCKDINLTLTADYMDLASEEPLQTNMLRYNNPMTLCNTESEVGEPIDIPINIAPLAIIGMDYSDEEQEEQYISAYVGKRVAGLETSYSHDRDRYPFGGIVHCKWEYNGEIVKESDDVSCDLYDLRFDVVGDYDYTLTVTDTDGVKNSNIAHISIIELEIPVIEDDTTPDAFSFSDVVDASLNKFKYTYIVVNGINVSAPISVTNGKIAVNPTLGLSIGGESISSDSWSAESTFVQNGDKVYVAHMTSTDYDESVDSIVEIGGVSDTFTTTTVSEDKADIDPKIISAIDALHDNEELSVVVNFQPLNLSEFNGKLLVHIENGEYLYDGIWVSSDNYIYEGAVIRVKHTSSNKYESDVVTRLSIGSSVFNYTSRTKVEASSEPTITLADINIDVVVKKAGYIETGITHSSEVTIFENATHASTEAILIGGEFWRLNFTSTDCFVGVDSFIYKSGDAYGRVNINITAPTTAEAKDISHTMFNTEAIEGEYLMAYSASVDVSITKEASNGDSSLTVAGSEIVNYNYNPEDSFVGVDYFEYTLNETIDECSYSDVGRVDFTLKEYVAPTKLLAICQDPYTIGSELYKTDGTLSGTSLVKNINNLVYSGINSSGIGGFLSDENKIGDYLFFSAFDGDRELWQSDGVTTTENEINTNYISPATLRGGSNPQCFNMADDKLYFMASDKNESRYGIYMADGSSVTRMSDLRPAKTYHSYCGAMDYNEDTSSLYFFVETDNILTLKKANMDFSSVEDVISYENHDYSDIKSIGADIFYQISPKDSDSFYHSPELWIKRLGEEPREAFDGAYMFEHKLLKAEGKIYTAGHKVEYNDEVFNEENRKIRMFAITATGEEELFSFANGSIRNLLYLKGSIYFRLWHFESNGDEAYELYKYNIASTQLTHLTQLAVDLEDTYDDNEASIRDMYKFEDRIFVESIFVDLSGDNPINRHQLWTSDGSVDGTIVMHEIEAKESSYPIGFNHFKLNGEYYMQDDNGNVYKTDYTKSGTNIVIPDTCDIDTDWFAAPSIEGYELSTYYELNATITGITYDETKVSIVNGEYSIGDKEHWTSEESTIANGQIIYFRHLSSSEFETTVETVLNVGKTDATFRSTTKAEAVVGEDTVVVGELMWEDTEHVTGSENNVTWSAAYNYCANLELKGYTNWRLPDFRWESEEDEGINEMGTIMIGEYGAAEDERIIAEPFALITPAHDIWSWTNEGLGEEDEEPTSHVVGIFTGGSGNFDGMGNTYELNVRCVRTMEK